MTIVLVVWVAVGGVMGAPARYLLDRAISDRLDSELPLGTLIVNVTGSLLFGILTGLGLGHHLGPAPLALLGTGFCGAYTTFSTFTMEALQFLEEGEFVQAGITISASVLAGLAAATAGVALGLAV